MEGSSSTTARDPTSVYPSTTVLVVENDYVAEAAALCSLLGDECKTRSDRHGGNRNIVRLVTCNPELFVPTNRIGSNTSSSNHLKCNGWTPINWRCHEKLPQVGNRWATHLGSPDGIFGENELERALIGIDTHDSGGRADSLILCGSSRNLLQRVAKAVSSIPQISQVKQYQNRGNRSNGDSDSRPTHIPLVITSISPHRTLDWLARRVYWSQNGCGDQLPIVFCAFTSPLWYCRIICKGLVLLVPQSQARAGHSKLVVRPPGFETHCRRLWNKILQATQQPTLQPHMAVCPADLSLHKSSFNRGILPSSLSLPRWRGATSLFYELQDPSLYILSCLLVSLLDKQTRPSNPNINVGQLVLDIVTEVYQLYCALSTFLPENWYSFVVGNDTLLADVTQSSMLVAFTNNTTLEIMERMKHQEQRRRHRHKRRGIIMQYRSWLESAISRQAHAAWTLATIGEPTDMVPGGSDDTVDAAVTSATQSTLDMDRMFQGCLAHGLVLILEVGQILGLNLKKDLATTLYVTQKLQSMDQRHSTPQVRYHDRLGVTWNGSAAAMNLNRGIDIISTKLFGITSLDQLLSFLALDPTASLWHLPSLQSKL